MAGHERHTFLLGKSQIEFAGLSAKLYKRLQGDKFQSYPLFSVIILHLSQNLASGVLQVPLYLYLGDVVPELSKKP